jgi:hypothetical protein
MKPGTGLQQARRTDSDKVRVVMGTELLAITAAANINADHDIVTSLPGARAAYVRPSPSSLPGHN